MYDDGISRWFTIVFLSIAVLMLVGGTALVVITLPSTGVINTEQMELVAPNAKLAQTILYARCEHEVRRRIDVDPAWVGKTVDGVSKELDKNWRITAFAPTLVEMTGTEDLFCPQHWVLMLGMDGAPGVYQNRFGFEMVRMGDATLGKLDEETRETLVKGLAFDSRGELDEWVVTWKESQRQKSE